MLTLEAFNALLKTLEEPPAHAMFVLCTTEEHKIPETVISRCVRVPFVKAAADEVVESLHKVIDGEKLSITKEAIAMLANSVDGCFREGHKLLEQLAQKTGTVEVYDVEALVDGAQGIDPHIFANALVTGDAKAGLEEINRLEKSGVSFVVFSNKLVEFLRNEIRANYGIGEKKLTNVSISRLKQVTEKAMSSANEVKRCVVEQLPLEILAVELGDMTTTVVTQSSKGPTEVPKEKDVPTVKALKVAEAVKEAVKETETKEVEKETDRIVGDLNVTLDDVNKKWSDILSALTPKNHSVAGLLRSTKPKAIEGKYLVLEVFYKFHKEQLEQDIKRRMLEETLAQLVAPLSIRCILGEKVEQTLKTMPEHDNIKVVGEDAKLAEAVEDVFGLETH
jgi:DNA polymerase-3 subunit gamma/tau